jgi:hypothetical protein
MNFAAKRQLAVQVAARYREGTYSQKSAMLDESIELLSRLRWFCVYAGRSERRRRHRRRRPMRAMARRAVG